VVNNVVSTISQASRAVDEKFKNPFYFVQLENGTIAYVLKSSAEEARIANIKKALAGIFQTVLAKGKQDVAEVGAGNIHTAHYEYRMKCRKIFEVKQ